MKIKSGIAGVFVMVLYSATLASYAECPKETTTTDSGLKVSFEETCGKKVECLNPHAACAESEKVIETLKLIVHAYTEGNFDEFGKYMTEGVTTFDAGTHKLIVGKKDVVADVKKRWTEAHGGDSPVLSYTIYHPYAKVTGDKAVVTFKAIKEVGGKHPEKLVSKCTDIFVKEDGLWKKLHYRSDWEKENL
ncbi:MAG: nuclear transport factor 2 family protein [Cyanobacteria bacterium]|nr:nuclear transport factor 2 family protein [Cyanobacteriota bacterium]